MGAKLLVITINQKAWDEIFWWLIIAGVIACILCLPLVWLKITKNRQRRTSNELSIGWLIAIPIIPFAVVGIMELLVAWLNHG